MVFSGGKKGKYVVQQSTMPAQNPSSPGMALNGFGGVHAPNKTSPFPSQTNREKQWEEFHPSLSNDDLRPLACQTWNVYNVFAVWMSDVHSVAGYLTAASLFALRLSSWQVLLVLLVGILIVEFCCDLVAKPSQKAAVPYPVVNRAIFGVRGACIPAALRGSIAIAWYGIQTYLGSKALQVVILKFFPGLAKYASVENYGFLGLSALGWALFMALWAAQAIVFWHGMEAIKQFIDFAGPAVYVVMLALAIYLVVLAGGPLNLNFNLSDGEPLGRWESIPVTISAIALVVSYFAGPMLNFGDFSRYARSWPTVRWGNFLGLPVNFLFFSVLTVVTTSATKPVFGKVVTDPIEVMERIGSPFVILLGGTTLVVATVGINVVANFVSPAFDFSNLAPQYISWRTGGMITAMASVLLTPWNWYDNAKAIQYTLGVLAALIGPLHGILIAGYYLCLRQQIDVPSMYTVRKDAPYWYRGGWNPNAVWATAISGSLSIATVVAPLLPFPSLARLPDYSWFVGCITGFLLFWAFERRNPMIWQNKVTELGRYPKREDDEIAMTQNGGVFPKTYDIYGT